MKANELSCDLLREQQDVYNAHINRLLQGILEIKKVVQQ